MIGSVEKPTLEFLDSQKQEISNRFLDPCLTMLVDALEDFPTQALLFKQLSALICQPNSSYNQVQRNHIISGNAKADKILLPQVIDVIPTATDDNIIEIYKILFTMLHEYRFNKGPLTPISGFVQGYTDNGLLAERVKKSIESIAEKLNDNKPCHVTLLSDIQIGEIVVESLESLVNKKSLDLMSTSTTASTSATASTSTTASSNHKRKAEGISTTNASESKKRRKDSMSQTNTQRMERLVRTIETVPQSDGPIDDELQQMFRRLISVRLAFEISQLQAAQALFMGMHSAHLRRRTISFLANNENLEPNEDNVFAEFMGPLARRPAR